MPRKLNPIPLEAGKLYRSNPSEANKSKGLCYVLVKEVLPDGRITVATYHPDAEVRKFVHRRTVQPRSYDSYCLAPVDFADEPAEFRSPEGLRLDAIAAAEKVAREEREKAEAREQAHRDELAADLAALASSRTVEEAAAKMRAESERKAAEGEPVSREATQAALALVTTTAPLPKVTCATPESQALYDDLCALFSSRMRDNLRIGEALIALGLRAVRASRETPVIGEFAPA
jgi:hypothetical protein